MTDLWTNREHDAGRLARAHAVPDDDRPELSDVADEMACEECGDDTGRGGYVNFGCSRDPDCPGGDCCDIPCLTCREQGRGR